MEYRAAGAHDIKSIARLHAESWRHHYRGLYSDAYLDGDVFTDRLAVWAELLSSPNADHDTVVALEADEVVGFVHTILGHDPRWGALLDNLHVAPERKGAGIGTQLMATAAAAVLARTPVTGLYLWVLEANIAAQAFYRARGGIPEDSEWFEPPGGGHILGLRFAWRDPRVLR